MDEPFDIEKEALIKIVLDEAYSYSAEGFRLASGALSHDYIDMRKALSKGKNLEIFAKALIKAAEPQLKSQQIDAIGGMTMGADPISHAVSVLSQISWFSVRKEAKSHGTKKYIEGYQPNKSSKLMIVDDTVTSGGSLFKVAQIVRNLGSEILIAFSILDRGNAARTLFEKEHINYKSLLTYEDIGIDPVN
jgi:orotate phosphoribosyltransferase